MTSASSLKKYDERLDSNSGRYNVGNSHRILNTCSKYMQSVGSDVQEIRLRGEHGDHYRVMYIAKFEEVIYVIHAFEKTSAKTEQKDIELAKSRLQDVKAMRKKI
jgi:phage-related protein